MTSDRGRTSVTTSLGCFMAAALALAAAGDSLAAVGMETPQSSVRSADWEYPDDGSWAEEVSNNCGFASQSPIEITTADAMASRRQLAMTYSKSHFSAFNNGHTLEAELEAEGRSSGDNYIEIRGTKFHLLQFHFHSPAEHSIPDAPGSSLQTHGALVAHLVHASDDGVLAVVGVVFDLGDAHPTIDRMFRPKLQKEDVHVGMELDPATLLPDDRSFYAYNGSLTTPPCSQKVRWHVMMNIGEVSQQQVDFFTDIFPLSTRNLQDLNGRQILIGS